MADLLDTHCKFYDKFVIYILCSDASIWISSKKKKTGSTIKKLFWTNFSATYVVLKAQIRFLSNPCTCMKVNKPLHYCREVYLSRVNIDLYYCTLEAQSTHWYSRECSPRNRCNQLMILSLNRDIWNTVYSKAIFTNAINTNMNIWGDALKQCIKENVLVRSL